MTRKLKIAIICIALSLGVVSISCGLEGGCRNGQTINGNPCE
jgi:hypothetical protein